MAKQESNKEKTNLEMEAAVLRLRMSSESLSHYFGDAKFHFPELLPDDNEQEAAVFRAANFIAKHGNQDKGHKILGADLAALIHYIADMIG